jgi:hypothetical protein
MVFEYDYPETEVNHRGGPNWDVMCLHAEAAKRTPSARAVAPVRWDHADRYASGRISEDHPTDA